MSENWVKIFTTDLLYKAEIARGVLEEHEIKAVVLNKQDSAYVSIGQFELYVYQQEVLRASNLIKDIKYE